MTKENAHDESETNSCGVDQSWASATCRELNKLRTSDNVLDKWEAVCQIMIVFINRNECIRLFCREIEELYRSVIDAAHREIFLKIRRRLTRPERRLFLLMYCATPALGGRIGILDPQISSFYWGMDEHTQGLVWLVAIFGIKSFGGEMHLDRELDQRFRTYLKFYPYWVTLIRQHENASKRRKSYEKRTTSLSHPLGENSVLEDILPDPQTLSGNPLAALAAASPTTLREWTERYCRPTDIPRFMKYYEEDMTESDIARQEGVTQQAVSLTIKRAVQDLKSGLRRAGII